MKKLILITCLVSIFSVNLEAQLFVTKNGFIKFFSSTPVEDIQAKNNQVNCAYDVKSGNLVFKVLIKSFVFEKALMQEHFNDDYMESNKLPSANFTGKVTNVGEINFTKDGIYKATVEGSLSIHGITKKVTESGTFEVKGDKLLLKSKFNVMFADYNIKIPGAVAKSFNDFIEITVDATLDKINNK